MYLLTNAEAFFAALDADQATASVAEGEEDRVEDTGIDGARGRRQDGDKDQREET
jgi:hypothetical protein